MSTFLLSETASGYSLFQVLEADVIATQVDSMQAAIAEYSRFSKMVKLVAFSPFRSAEHALEDVNMVSEGAVSDFLQNFLETNLPLGKGASLRLGVHRDPKYKSAVSDALEGEVSIVADDDIEELLRGLRMHIHHFIAGLTLADVTQAQLGIAHSYSRSKVKFNVHKADNMIIQAIALLDQLDKDINTFAMRMREWYSWHFPELVKVVPDNIVYARVVCLIKDKASLSEESLPKLTDLLDNEQQAQDVLDAARSSMGTDISEVDLINIDMFAGKVVRLAEYRKSLHDYLVSKMSIVAPNLAALIGEQVGARLISHAGSLTSLAKYPASTVQILGAEKALFRALKTKGKTPKYGLLYHSTFIGRAKAKNKGRISRYLANKCSIASRMDCFSDFSSDVFGRKLREQVEERLEFYDSGTAPRKNLDVMREASKEAEAERDDDDEETEEVKTPKKIKAGKKEGVKTPKAKVKVEKAGDDEDAEAKTPSKTPTKTPESSKKSKKDKKKDKKKRKSEVLEAKTPESKAEKSSSKKEKKRKRVSE